MRRASLDALVPTTIARATPREFADLLAKFPTICTQVAAMVELRRAYFSGRADAALLRVEDDSNAYPVHSQ